MNEIERGVDMKMLTVMRMSARRILMDPKEYLFGFLLLQSIRWTIGLPLISFLFYMMLNSAGLVSITNTNVVQLFASPVAIIVLTVLLFLLTFLAFYEFGYYFLLAKYQRSETTFTYKTILKQLNKKIPKFFNLHMIFFTLYVGLLLPIASLGMSTSWTEALQIPHFITDELMNTMSGKLLLFTSLVIVLYVNARLIFTVLYFATNESISMREALKKSWHETKGKVGRIVPSLIIIVSSFALVALTTTFILSLPLMISESVFDIQLPIVAGFTLAMIQGALFTLTALLQPMLTEAVTVIERGEEQLGKVTSYRKTFGTYLKRFWPVLMLAFIGFGLLHTNTLKQTVYQPITKIVAHRGYSAVALENTIASLEAAAKAGADLVEMDIQETKDGKFVVYHDKTLRRLAGDSRTVGQMTLEELTNVTISNGKYQEAIPSFEEYIDVAKELDIRLLVETKTYGHETSEMEENLVALLHEKEIAYDYVIQSLDIPNLRKISDIDPLIPTSDVIALNVGELPNTPAPFLSLEDFSVTKKLVTHANERDKKIFVWTVNKEDLMHTYMRLGVYGLITNHVTDAVKVRNVYEEEQGLYQRLKWILEEQNPF